MPTAISRAAAAGAAQRAHPQGVPNAGIRLRAERCGRINPSLRSAASMEFQTLGLGSLASSKDGADEIISSNSLTSDEQAGQLCKCRCCSALLRLSASDKLSCNSTHVIPLSPSHLPKHARSGVAPALAPLPQFNQSLKPLRSASPEPLFPSRLSGLFGSIHLEQVAQLHSCLVQLGLAVADRTSNNLGDLIMLVSLHVVKHKDRAIPGWKAFYRPL